MPFLPDLSLLETAARSVYAVMPPTPQYAWPLLGRALGADVWVKHENHTPTGCFKMRGGLVYFEALRQSGAADAGVVSATRGNHGQSVGFAARLHGMRASIVVPRGNSREKNAAMRALGVELIEHGDDFQAAREHAEQLAQQRGLHMIPSLHPDLVRGVATYWLELFRAVADVDTVLVPIGQGSGICAAVAARQALGLRTRIVGVVSAHADAYAQSFETRRPCSAPVTTRVADGLACRVPDAAALELIWQHVDEVLRVNDDEVLRAMQLYYTATHNVAEGAGAAALAGALQIRQRLQGQRIALPLSGANVDAELFGEALRAA